MQKEKLPPKGLFPTNSDPGKYERLRKRWLYDTGAHTLSAELRGIWNKFRKVDERIDALEDRLKELDGISMPRHIARPKTTVDEYHIDRFLPDDES